MNNYKWAEYLEEIANTPSGNRRVAKLGEVAGEWPGILEVLKYSMDPQITFGIDTIPKPGIAGSQPVSWTKIRDDLLDPLRKRELTGNRAVEAVHNWLETCTKPEQKWLTRILQQKLRIGLGPKSVNKVAPGTVSEFSVVRGVSFKDLKPHELEDFWFVQPKANGARVVARLDKENGVSLLSRTGHKWENFDDILAKLEVYNKCRDSNEVLYIDGEVVSYVNDRINFQAIQKTMNASKTKAVHGDLVYMVFDAAEESEWLNPQKNYIDRYTFAEQLVYDEIGASNINMIDNGDLGGVISPSHEMLEKMCIEYVEEGWEGVMLRRDIPVKLSKNKSLVKVKLFDDSEAEIVDVEEGKGAREGMAGQLVCKWHNGNIFRVGSGLTEADCIYFWNNKEEIIGQFVNFKYFNETDDGNPFHPTFNGLRDFEDFE